MKLSPKLGFNVVGISYLKAKIIMFHTFLEYLGQES